MRKVELGFVLSIAVFLIGFSSLGLLYYDYSVGLMRFPLLAAGFTLVVLVVHLVLMCSGRAMPLDGGSAPSALVTALRSPRRRQTLSRLLSIFSIVPIVFALGYPLGLAVYLLGVLRHFGEGWMISSAVAGMSLLVSYGLFVRTLGVSLPVMPAWWQAVAG